MVLLKDAADYSKENQKDPTHSIRVEKILVKNGVSDITTRASALLHESVTEGTGKISEIQSFFSPEIAGLVYTLSKIQKINLTANSPENIVRIRRIMTSLSVDFRVFVIKMACRLDNLKHSDKLPFEQRIVLAKQALEIDAPLAESASLRAMASQMQDIGFRITDPEKYKLLSWEINQRKSFMEKDLLIAKESLEKLLQNHSLRTTVSFRQKSLYSTHLKILKYLKLLKIPNYNASGIHDLLGMRVITNTKKDCYRALDIVHKNWVPAMDEFDDYIACPKPNGYQSIHTVINLPHGTTCEVQIRTKEMDHYNTYGSASHLGYKAKGLNIAVSDIKWEKGFNSIFIFTPKKDIVELKQGATPIDFAYKVHTDLGDRADKAIVNGKIKKLTYTLQNGDEVKILTTNRKTPLRSRN